MAPSSFSRLVLAGFLNPMYPIWLLPAMIIVYATGQHIENLHVLNVVQERKEWDLNQLLRQPFESMNRLG